MAKYQRYAEYKNSGVEWLGEMPASWDLKKHKYIAVFSKGKNPEPLLDNYSDGLYPYLSMDSLRGKANSKYAEYRKGLVLVEDNQPLIIWDGSNSGEFVLGKKGILSSTMASASLIYKLESKFYWYVCICIEPEMRKHATGMGIPHVNGEELRGIELPLPEIGEQKIIANFLDHETAKIDSLIEKQQQLIELLKEKRQAVISHAVTKGLNPDVPMKDSGVEWLGEVPEHWETSKIKYVAELTPKKSELSNSDSRFCTFVPMEKLKLGSLVKDEEKLISEVIGGYTYFKDGDLLLAKVTPCFENKNMVVASGLKNGIGFGSSEIYVLRTNHKVDTQFLYYRLQEDQFMELGAGAMTGAGGLKRVPSEFLNNFEFALPPLSEQIVITKFLNEYLIKNENLMNKAQSAIHLMQERRTALISAAVTGKIDVRNWQAPNATEREMEVST